MNHSKRVAVGCLGIAAFAILGGVLVALNWDRIAVALDSRAAGARATLFRLGEVMSIGAALREEFGLDLEAGYVTSTGSRILRITCTDCDLPPDTTARAFCRGIAVAAIDTTTRHDQIDTVEIVFRFSAEENGTQASAPCSFALEELTRGR